MILFILCFKNIFLCANVDSMKIKNICFYCIVTFISCDVFASTDLTAYINTNCATGNCNLEGNTYVNTRVINVPYFDVVSGVFASIQNSGTISGEINVAAGGGLTQVVENPADITHLNVSGNGLFDATFIGGAFSLNQIADKMYSVKELNLASVGQATELTISGGYNATKLQNTSIKVNGDVWIVVSSDFKTNGNPVLYNVNNAEYNKLHFESDTNNPLYAVTASLVGNNVYLTRARTINYKHVFRDSRGMFLNYLRETGSDNDLISKLDSENDMNRVMDILNKSVRLNPELLMRSVHEINMLEMTSGSANRIGVGISAEPIYIFSNHGNTIGGRLAAKYSVTDNLYVGASGYGYKIHFDDGLNKYDSGVYGGNMRIDYVGDIVFVRGGLGGNIDSFDTGPLLNGNEITHNPTGNSLYGFVDLGKHFNIGNDGWYVAPFVNVGMERLHILQNNKNDFFARGAFDGGYSFVLDSMKYSYNLRAGVNTFGNIDAAFNFDAWSEVDGAGGNISLGVIQTELGLSGKASINLQMVF
ncbi:MAG: autotransporter outer membrane beta-barrel domain-containing protein [Alphaproteobacteria bacterium]|nr:autotransporter outer membrane beta-barrel domain-containing protein [Alphaproteobacteria bacterium]